MAALLVLGLTVTTTDPCSCASLCPHGVRCGAGHADYPDSHWWPNCEQGCSKPSATIRRCDEGWWEATMTDCGHVLTDTSPAQLTRDSAAHRRTCTEEEV